MCVGLLPQNNTSLYANSPCSWAKEAPLLHLNPGNIFVCPSLQRSSIKPRCFMPEHSNTQRSSLTPQQFYLLNTRLFVGVQAFLIEKRELTVFVYESRSFHFRQNHIYPENLHTQKTAELTRIKLPESNLTANKCKKKMLRLKQWLFKEECRWFYK